MSPLLAGAARRCITPQLGCHIMGLFHDRLATDIHDDLYARALVLQDDTTSLAIVICDLIALLKSDVDDVRRYVADLTGIPAAHTFVACTHTHYGPATVGALGTPLDDVYMEHAAELIAESVKLAQNRLVPAEVGATRVAVHGETFNRRWHMRDGSVRMNPGFQNPDLVRPAGPTDPELTLLVVRDLGRKPLALLSSLATHYVGNATENSISADYYGYFEKALQRMAGDEIVGMLGYGCAGNINTWDFSKPAPETPHSYYQAERVGNVVAAAAYGGWQGLRDFQYSRAPVLGAASEVIEFVRSQPDAAALAHARAASAGPMPAPDAAGYMDWLYAREAVLVTEEPAVSPAEVMALRVGDLGIVGLPGEPFVEYGLQIKARAPLPMIMPFGLANDALGYFPTDAALIEGGYETRLARSAKAVPGIESAMVAAGVDALQRLSS